MSLQMWNSWFFVRCINVLWVYLVFNMLQQLSTYHTNEQLSTVPATVPPLMASSSSAHDTLGLAALSWHNNHKTSHQSLALKLDTYGRHWSINLLAGMDQLITFNIASWYRHHRKTINTILVFLIFLWTPYLSRACLFHVSKCSRQPKRPWPLTRTTLAWKWWRHYRFSNTHSNMAKIWILQRVSTGMKSWQRWRGPINLSCIHQKILTHLLPTWAWMPLSLGAALDME